ncbi:hypothetical protein [Embleya sp. NBC_00896]|uniref:hypothetical protein n=1 Tax=Embleya sp. NBC_00896 TaxID=2975961 RepID=UPI00386ECDE8|nr:hypothetical protein OG928_47855 [Embleya sp. NBC_00896]
MVVTLDNGHGKDARELYAELVAEVNLVKRARGDCADAVEMPGSFSGPEPAWSVDVMGRVGRPTAARPAMNLIRHGVASRTRAFSAGSTGSGAVPALLTAKALAPILHVTRRIEAPVTLDDVDAG